MIPLVKGKIKRFLTFFGTRHLGLKIHENRLFDCPKSTFSDNFCH